MRRRLAMFVVLGASGHTGKVVAETLLGQKKKVRVVLRDAGKTRAWKEAGADVAIADVEDGAALKHAFNGAEGVYVLLPPNFASSQVRIDNGRRTKIIVAAIEAASVPHVVMLSSVGAQQSNGTGPVLGLRDAEAAFSRATAAVTFLRAAYFMENWGDRSTPLARVSFRRSLSPTRRFLSLRPETSVPPPRAYLLRVAAANGLSSWQDRASTRRVMSPQPWSGSWESRS